MSEFLKKLPETKNFSIRSFVSGFLFTDGGASMGVLPKAIWSKKTDVDDKNRIKLALRHLFICINGIKIVIDTGIGNILSDKEIKIYKPTQFTMHQELEKLGTSPEEIDYVILTHLHFDHAGGIVSSSEKKAKLTFPNAIYIIQKEEWETAKNPDKLNKAAYNFDKHLSLLEAKGQIKFFDKSITIEDDIEVVKVGGHSNGTSIVNIYIDNQKWVYAGDIIPNHFHTSLPVISAYDISRKDTFIAKKDLLDEANLVIFDHDPIYACTKISNPPFGKIKK
ncbi:MAG: MBL fold metallo-hydrolase [Candidatus Cloacimonadota bacterium]|nr:MBL fold metallo-hydrolase [Candidatus Cloacimonadota bacterium]